MVKPIFPSQRSDAAQARVPVSDYNRADVVGDSYQAASDEDESRAARVASNDDNVFSSYSSFAPSSGLDLLRSQPFQSYDGSLPHALPIPAPRERIASLPEWEDHNTPPLPRLRRSSVPVAMEFGGGDSSSSSMRFEATDSIPPALRDIAAKGQELFWFILSEEVKAQEASSPGSLSALTISPSSQRMEVLNERARFGGRTLRQIAEAFSHSSHRMRVREYADSVHLQSLNYNSFSDLLFGLFQEGGVTQARVLVLFFFCADVALRALRENLTKHFQQLVDWTSRYITERLSAWVLEHGGWAAVLQESVDQAYKLAVVGVCALSIAALCTFLWKHR